MDLARWRRFLKIGKGMKKVRSYCIVFAACISGLWLANASADEVYTFTVHGIVKGLPGAGRAPNELLVKHDPIPEYRDSSGKVVGMAAMTMPFYLEQGVSVGGIKVNDEVELKVAQRIVPTFTEKVVEVVKK